MVNKYKTKRGHIVQEIKIEGDSVCVKVISLVSGKSPSTLENDILWVKLKNLTLIPEEIKGGV